MRKDLLAAACTLGMSLSIASADIVSFIEDTGFPTTTGDSFDLTLNANSNTATTSNGASAAFGDRISFTGADTVNDDFVLTFHAGFDFDETSASWDQTDADSSNFMQIRSGNNDGLSPFGSNAAFNSGEILWFEVSGLDAGTTLELNGFSMGENNPFLTGRFEYYTGDSGSISVGTSITTAATTFGSAIALENGDRFGIAHLAAAAPANRSGLVTLDFTVVPEPSAYALLAGILALSSVALRRRR